MNWDRLSPKAKRRWIAWVKTQSHLDLNRKKDYLEDWGAPMRYIDQHRADLDNDTHIESGYIPVEEVEQELINTCIHLLEK